MAVGLTVTNTGEFTVAAMRRYIKKTPVIGAADHLYNNPIG
jgi:hypothetical protein